eukprot:579570_1
MASLTEPNELFREELLCSGYIRELEQLVAYTFSVPIQSIIRLYCFMFKWNQNEDSHGKAVEFESDRTLIHYPRESKHTWAIMTASNILAPHQGYRKLKWEIMTQVSETEMGNNDTRIGNAKCKHH